MPSDLSSKIERQFSVAEPHAERLEARAPRSMVARRFNRLSLNAKLRAAVLANAAILLTVVLTIVAGMAAVAAFGQKQAALRDAEARTNQASLSVMEAALSLHMYEDNMSPVDLAKARQDLEDAREKLGVASGQLRSGLDPVVLTNLTEFDGRIAVLSEKLEQDSRTNELEAAREANGSLGVLRKDLLEEAQSIQQMAFSASKDLRTVGWGIIFAGIVLCVIAVSLAVVGSRVIFRSIVSAITQITFAMGEISKGRHDTPIPGRERRDELGAMARALTRFQRDSLELRHLHEERAQSAERELQQLEEARTSRVALIEKTMDDFKLSIGQAIDDVVAASAQLRGSSHTMADLAERSATQSSEASASMERTAQNVASAAAATDEFTSSIAKISGDANESAELARQAGSLVSNAHAKMESLSVAAVEVGEIAELIRTIAHRTNLLALNASIEAARGGEQGRGFAVVASEVKELANQTAQATHTVSERISLMQASTSESVSDLTAIVDQIRDLERVAEQIADAVGTQARSGDLLARNIDSASQGSDAVAERLEKLLSVSLATGETASKVEALARSLDEQGDDLNKKAERFLTDLRSNMTVSPVTSGGRGHLLAVANGA
ncbi:methyl-accepting chemotaxis protein [Altererythrobacter lutimaris]|nr:HAMP domain-containing methyl-accepting chemotaxis protein [Altererythrobacter lutimaris]